MVYISYLAADKMQLASIMVQPTRADPNWNYEFDDLSVIKQPDDFYRQKLPYMLINDPLGDPNQFLLGGTYMGVGSIMRLYKRNGLLHWNTQIESITSVQAVVSVGSAQFFFGCGQNNYADR